jgi:hypothetical protein
MLEMAVSISFVEYPIFVSGSPSHYLYKLLCVRFSFYDEPTGRGGARGGRGGAGGMKGGAKVTKNPNHAHAHTSLCLYSPSVVLLSQFSRLRQPSFSYDH